MPLHEQLEETEMCHWALNKATLHVPAKEAEQGSNKPSLPGEATDLKVSLLTDNVTAS